MKIPELSANAQAILEQPITRDDARAVEQYFDRFEFTTTALYLIAGHLASDEVGDEEAAQIVADAVVRLAEHEAKRL